MGLHVIEGEPEPKEPKRQRPHETFPTVKLDPTNLRPSWPLVAAMLEQLGSWGTNALRLGLIAHAHVCLHELARPGASAQCLDDLRQLVEALAHMPRER